MTPEEAIDKLLDIASIEYGVPKRMLLGQVKDTSEEAEKEVTKYYEYIERIYDKYK